MKYSTILLIAVLLFSLAIVFVAKEEEINVEKEKLDYEEVHNHPQTVYDNPMAPPKEIDDAVKKDFYKKRKGYRPYGSRQRREDTLLDKSKDFLADQWREGEKLLGYPWKKMNRWMHSMFDRDRRGRRPYASNKQRDDRRYYGPMYPYYRYDDTTSDDSSLMDYRPWGYEEEEDDMTRWPSLMMERPLTRWIDYFKDQWNHVVPFHSRFDKIASSVNEKDDKYVFKVINVPDQLKKKDLIVKLSNEGGRDILDITTKLETEEEKDFFEKKYIFPKNVDKKSIRAKFDDKERILTVEVYKLKGEENLINVPIE